jgi:hypothetical protein
VALIEAQEDLRELRTLLRDKGRLPPEGMTALKTAALQTGVSYESARRRPRTPAGAACRCAVVRQRA